MTQKTTLNILTFCGNFRTFVIVSENIFSITVSKCKVFLNVTFLTFATQTVQHFLKNNNKMFTNLFCTDALICFNSFKHFFHQKALKQIGIFEEMSQLSFFYLTNDSYFLPIASQSIFLFLQLIGSPATLMTFFQQTFLNFLQLY